MTSSLRTSLLLCVTLCVGCDALACYESNGNGETLLKNNDTWTYCGLIPTQANEQVLIPGVQFGYGPKHVWADTYMTTFGQNNEMYQVLTMCTYSEYNVGGGLGSFLMTRHDDRRYVFKCVCNFDKCNSQATFGAYMASLKVASYAKSR